VHCWEPGRCIPWRGRAALFTSAKGWWKVGVVPDPYFEIWKRAKLEIITGTTYIF